MLLDHDLTSNVLPCMITICFKCNNSHRNERFHNCGSGSRLFKDVLWSEAAQAWQHRLTHKSATVAQYGLSILQAFVCSENIQLLAGLLTGRGAIHLHFHFQLVQLLAWEPEAAGRHSSRSLQICVTGQLLDSQESSHRSHYSAAPGESVRPNSVTFVAPMTSDPCLLLGTLSTCVTLQAQATISHIRNCRSTCLHLKGLA